MTIHYLHRAVPDDRGLYDTVAEQLRIERAIAEAERTHRIVRWQNAVTVACYVLAVLVVCYFAAELGRAL
jgi:hypothetical protein